MLFSLLYVLNMQFLPLNALFLALETSKTRRFSVRYAISMPFLTCNTPSMYYFLCITLFAYCFLLQQQSIFRSWTKYLQSLESKIAGVGGCAAEVKGQRNQACQSYAVEPTHLYYLWASPPLESYFYRWK